MGRTIMIVAGEASGDRHGAHLVRAMQQRSPAISFCGIGGGNMRAAGVHLLADASKLAVVGITEVAAKIPHILRGYRAAKTTIKDLRPDLLVLIDFPDFNFRLAAVAKKHGIKVLYYISPQVWAWRSGRVKTIRRRVDHMAVILPFEEAFYRQRGVKATFVGHPLLDRPRRPVPPDDGDRSRSGVLRIGLMPGSRDAEISRHLPVMLQTARQLTDDMPGRGLGFVLSVAPTVDPQRVADMVAAHGAGLPLEIHTEAVETFFSRCDLGIVVSGTVTMEAALAGMPMVIIYKVSPVSYWLGKMLIDVKYIGLANLIADRELAPELIQDQARPEIIAAHVVTLLADTSRLEHLRREMIRVKELLGGPGASHRVADIAFALMDDAPPLSAETATTAVT